jgi:hypothetical protein
MDNLIKAYTQTLYKVNGFLNPIIIGKISDELEQYLVQNNVRCWAYITAYNPMSERLSEEENENRNSQLRNDLRDYIKIKGIGVDLNGKWIGEKSFLVLGIDRTNAISLARKYGQKGVVYGEIGEPAELLLTN